MEEPGGRYHRWCSQQSSPDECLSLLQGDLSLADAGVRRQLALSFAWDGVWDGVAAEVRGMVDPLMLKAMITTAVAAYMGLLILPEPVTKVVAVSLTAILIAYVGWNAFFDILEGWRELSARSERALSFEELEHAGHRFGDVMGRDGARVIIMAVTAALGGGAAHLASKAPTLPAFARAAQAARMNAGFELSTAIEGGARTVAIAEGGITLELAPNVVAAVAAGSSGGAVGCGGVGSGAAGGAQQAARAIDPNKLSHIFGKAAHNLGPLIQTFGSQEATFTAVESATQAAVKAQGLTGVFETTVSVAGQNVVVRGNVIGGVARIGTFFIP